MRKTNLFILLFPVFFMYCNSASDPFATKVKKIIADNRIDEKEWTDLLNIKIDSTKKIYSSFFVNGDINENKLKEYLSKVNSSRKNATNLVFFVPEEKIINPRVNVFLENSGSMFGYMQGTTSFESAVMDFLVDIDYHYKSNLGFYYINRDTFPQKKDLVNFVNDLEPDEIKKFGDVGSSNLNSVFKQILNITNKNDIGIFISDCIYSIKGDNPIDLLNHERSLTKKAFLDKSDFKVTTIVIKLISDFNGKYWYWDDEKQKEIYKKINQKRPFYIWIIGSLPAMKVFYKKVDFEKLKTLKGYDNIYLMANADDTKPPFYTILQSTGERGRFNPDKLHANQDFIHGIENIKPMRKNRNNPSKKKYNQKSN